MIYHNIISTHSPRVGRTRIAKALGITTDISTHSPRVGRTDKKDYSSVKPWHFNSLAPCGANPGAAVLFTRAPDFNSLAPCGANLILHKIATATASISTHSPRVGRTRRCNMCIIAIYISTHSPRVGRTSTSCIFVDRSPLLGVDNNFFSRLDCHFLRCSSANLARFSNQSRFAIRT